MRASPSWFLPKYTDPSLLSMKYAIKLMISLSVLLLQHIFIFYLKKIYIAVSGTNSENGVQ